MLLAWCFLRLTIILAEHLILAAIFILIVAFRSVLVALPFNTSSL